MEEPGFENIGDAFTAKFGTQRDQLMGRISGFRDVSMGDPGLYVSPSLLDGSSGINRPGVRILHPDTPLVMKPIHDTNFVQPVTSGSITYLLPKCQFGHKRSAKIVMGTIEKLRKIGPG